MTSWVCSPANIDPKDVNFLKKINDPKLICPIFFEYWTFKYLYKSKPKSLPYTINI